MIILSLVCIILSQCKIVYLPLCMLLLLLPKEKFKSKKDRIIKILFILIMVLILSFVWLKIASVFLKSNYVSSSKQITYIIENPFRYFMIFLRTMNKNFQTYIFQFLGTYLGWLDIIVPVTYIIINLVFILFLMIRSDDKDVILSFKDKLLLMIIFLLVIVLIFTSLYVQWTKYKNGIIEGVQGRYFLPIVILVPFIISNKIFKNTTDRIIKITTNSIRNYLYTYLIFESLFTISIVILQFL